MLPLFVLILVICTINGQIYIVPPPVQNYPQPLNYATPPNQPVPIETQLDDPYATMEIFRHSKKVLTAESGKPVSIQIETNKPQVQVVTSESQVNVHGTPDYFALYGGQAPAAAEHNEDYSNLFGNSPVASGYSHPKSSADLKEFSNSPVATDYIYPNSPSDLKEFSNSPVVSDYIYPNSPSDLNKFSNLPLGSRYTPTKISLNQQNEFLNSPRGSGYSYPKSEFSNSPEFSEVSAGLQEPKDDAQGKPSRYFPIQQNNFAPLNDFGPVTFNNNNANKVAEIVKGRQYSKSGKPKKKYSSKLSKYPKKFKSSLKKLNGKTKLNPNSELNDDFSLDSLKNKRRIPSSISEPSAELSNNDFTEDFSSFPSNKGTHSDFTSGSGSSGFSGGSGSGGSGFSGGSGSGGAGFSGGLTSGGSSGFSAPGGGGDERMQFQMFGMDGPHSYKFGYDTGKGHNRHFRFEERDNHGKVKGHYGFYDQEGKMSMIHYEADPHSGYKAGPYRHPDNHHDFDYNHQNHDES